MRFLNIPLGLFFVALSTLMLELTLIRVFDVVWHPNMAYMIITLAMLCFGTAGVYYSVKPLKNLNNIRSYIANVAQLFALSTFAIYPILNFLPFDFHLFSNKPLKATLLFLGIYSTLALPFFFAGLIFSAVFTVYSRKIRMLYFWDLTGAAIGCFILIPFLPIIGTGGLVFLAVSLALLASGLFGENRKWLITTVVLGSFIIFIPFSLHPKHYLEFEQHTNKRSLKHFKDAKLIEKTFWDPISKIDIVNLGNKKFIAYDGGSQSSYVYPFDGDYKKLRKNLPEMANTHFWGRMVLASHYLKRDTKHSVLIIGSAGGQETKAALVYGADHVDAVELVNFVVQVGQKDFNNYNGGIFTHPSVNAITGEGRSFLRSNQRQYDIIQMFSNHTSSSIASGTGAMSANYLQTVEAYEEYFLNLKKTGILHINHHIYPKILTTAAKAWDNMGGQEFQKHVLVFEKPNVMDNLPTVLIKMSPWTQSEVDQLRTFMGRGNQVVMNPLHTETNFLPDQLLTGELPKDLTDRIDFVIQPATDDKPFFNFLRKKTSKVSVDKENYLNRSTAGLLNVQLSTFVPMDIVHLVVTGLTSLIFACLFVFVSFYFSSNNRAHWELKWKTSIYFSCLGAGFIIIELVFIQLFMRLIGYPLYTYSTVVFALLLSAGIGSLSSKKMSIGLNKRWFWPYVGVVATGIITLVTHSFITDIFLTATTPVRICIAILLISPVGFFLGMPFPLGILTIKAEENGAIGWVWGLNGLFTVIGGIMSVVLSIIFGFKTTLIIALAIYLIAFLMMSQLRLKNIHVDGTV